MAKSWLPVFAVIALSIALAGCKENNTYIMSKAEGQGPAVSASPRGGRYSPDVQVTLTADEPCTIYYTTNGTRPTDSSTRYTTSLNITQPGFTPLWFFGIDRQRNAGDEAFVTYYVVASPENLTPSSTDAQGPFIVTDGSDNIHIFWGDDIDGDDDIYYMNSSAWGTSQNITNTGYDCNYPRAAVDSSDVLHVFFIADLGNQEGVYMNSTSWATTVNVTNTGTGSYPADIAVDSSGTVHVLWKEIEPSSTDYWYANSTNWSSSVNVTGPSTNVNYGKMCVDSTNTVHVVYCDEVDGQYKLFYTNSLDWAGNRTILYPELGESEWCDITVDSQDRLHISWSQKGSDGLDRVLYFDSDSFEPDPIVVSDPFAGTSYTCVTVGPDGSIHFIWEANFDGKGYLYAATRYSVQVIECETGKLVGEFGSYGNMDCAGRGSACPHPELPFGLISALSVWKDRLFVVDQLNRRIARLRIIYDPSKRAVSAPRKE